MNYGIYQQAALIEGLVGERWRGLYVNNPEFHAAIHALAALLPIWVDGIAENSAKQAVGWAAELQRMREARVLHLDETSSAPAE